MEIEISSSDSETVSGLVLAIARLSGITPQQFVDEIDDNSLTKDYALQIMELLQKQKIQTLRNVLKRKEQSNAE